MRMGDLPFAEVDLVAAAIAEMPYAPSHRSVIESLVAFTQHGALSWDDDWDLTGMRSDDILEDATGALIRVGAVRKLFRAKGYALPKALCASQEDADAEQSPAKPKKAKVGRPGSKHLCLAEMKRRADAGLLLARPTKEASHLSAWLRRSHPTAISMEPKSVYNAIRDEHKALKERIKL